MPITPHFDISQSDSHVQINIKVPHVRVSPDSVQVVLTDDNRCLHFASPPYLLVLTFQQAFQDNAEDSCAQYEPLKEHGTIVLKLAKEESGVYWDDLDLVGSLMKPHGNLKNLVKDASPQKSKWLQEVLAETAEEEIDQNPENSTEATTFLSERTKLTGYGFANMFRGVFTDLARDGLAREMLEAPLDADSHIVRIDNPLSFASTDLDFRAVQENQKQKRQEIEASKFSSERYLQDLDVEDDYLFQNAMLMKPHWSQTQFGTPENKMQNQCGISSNNEVADTLGEKEFFTPEESAQLASIPYPLLPSSCHDKAHLWLGILDIFFAYVYDHLLTDGEPTVESAWTISILSCSLSWLESFDNRERVEDIMAQSIRRALIYPYLRNFEFAAYLWKQVSCILKSGRRSVIRSLLQVRTILDQSELFYLGNKLYVDPYLAWLQRIPGATTSLMDEHLMNLAREIDTTMSYTDKLKQHVGLDLTRMEKELFESLEEEEESVSSSSEESGESDSSESEDNDSCERSIGSNEQSRNREPLQSNITVPATTASVVATNQTPRNCSNELLEMDNDRETSSLLVEMSSLSLNNCNSEGDATSDRHRKKMPWPLIQEIE